MRLPSKSRAFIILMVASAVSVLLLPRAWTNWVRRPFQPLVAFQWPFSSTARDAAQSVAMATEPALTAQEAQQLRLEAERLRRQVGQQSMRITAQQTRLDEVTRLAGQSLDNLAATIIAPVASYDADPRRASLRVVLTAQTAPYVHEGEWVVAGAAADPTKERLAEFWLIGQVTEVGTRVATVQLVTDPGFRLQVRAARILDDGTWQLDSRHCMLTGQGAGRMLIDQAEADYLKSGYGVVVAAPTDRPLPFPLSLGKIVESRPRKDSAQHVDLLVEPWEPATRLSHVYILSTGH